MQKDFFALDVETANSNRNSICEIGIVVVRDLEIKKKVRYLVKPPENKYENRNIKIHGIDSDKTKNSETFDVLWKKMEKAILTNLIVAHNASFDIDCINQTLNHYNIPIPEISYECTYKLTGYKLKIVASAYRIDLDHHKALSDAEACAKIYINLAKGIEPNYDIVDPELFEKKQVYKGSQKNKINKEDLIPDFENANKNSPLYMKKVLYTGIFHEMERHEVGHLAKELGAELKSSVSRKLDFVIIGDNPGPVKMKKIKEIQESGYPIKIINEAQFLAYVKAFHN